MAQNGSIDIIANTAITFKLIGQLVKTTGYRPTLPQLLKLYSSVITTSLIVASVDEVIDNLDLGGMLGNAGVGAVECGSKAYNRDKALIRKTVAKEARRDLIPVMKSEVKDIVAKVK